MIQNATTSFSEIREIALYLATVLFLFCFTPAIHFFFEFKKEKVKNHHKKQMPKPIRKWLKLKTPVRVALINSTKIIEY